MVSKAHVRSALIRRCFKSKDHNLLFKAFFCFRASYAIEYCSSVWNPHYHCDIVKIESVQHKFTRYIGAFSFMFNSERLGMLYAESLEFFYDV